MKLSKKFKRIIFVFVLISLLSIMVSSVSAGSFEVPAEIKARAEKIVLSFNQTQQVGDISIRYDFMQASTVRFWVKKGSGEDVAYFSEVYCLLDHDTCVHDLAPLSGNLATGGNPETGWGSNILIHIEEISEDKNSLVVWVDENEDMITECLTQINYLSNNGLYFGNFFANDPTISYSLPNPFLAYNEIKDFKTRYFRFEIDHSSNRFKLYLHNSVDTTQPSEQEVEMTFDFEECGDTYFKFDGEQFLLQPIYYLANGNYLLALKTITKVCPAEDLDNDIKLINLGIDDDIGNPLDEVFVKNVDKYGKSSIKMDIKIKDFGWKTYIFDSCSWNNIDENFSIKMAGIYGTSFEFYVKNKTTEGAEEGNKLGLLEWLYDFFGLV